MSPTGLPNQPSFAGWIPTITGHLSFSLIGLSGSAPGTVVANASSGAIEGRPSTLRHVAVCQSRRTRDLPWPFYLRSSAKAEYILLGTSKSATRPVLATDGSNAVEEHSDDVGALCGRIYVVPHHRDAAAAARAALRSIKKAIALAGDEAPRGGAGQLGGLSGKVRQILQDASAKGVVALGADFQLYRTGEFRLSLDSNEPTIADDEVPQNGARFNYLLASQIYYFTKDIAHRHYHHESSSDNLLPIVGAGPGDDESWRRETLWSLARAVLEMRRRRHLAGHKSALGILAYAEAFQGLLAQVQRRENGDGFERISSGPIYDFTHTRMSLDATIEEQDYRKSFWAQFQAVIIATVLAGGALWIGAVQIREAACSLPCKPPPAVPQWLAHVLRVLIEHPVFPFSIMLLVGLAYFEFARRSLKVIGPVRGYARWVSDWSVALGATASRQLRRMDPRSGDAFGSAVAIVMAALMMGGLLYYLGGIFRLWAVWVPWRLVQGL